MNLNNIIFPAPKNFNIPLSNYSDELIFVPRIKLNKQNQSINPENKSKQIKKQNIKNLYEKFEKLKEKEKIQFKKNDKSKKNELKRNNSAENLNNLNNTLDYEELPEERLLTYEQIEEKNYYKKNLFSNFSIANKKHSENASDFIPCLLLQLKHLPFPNQNSSTNSSKNQNKFCIFFHGNAEDIFLARVFAEKLRESLQMNIILVEYPGYSIYFDEKNCEKILDNSILIYEFLTKKLKIDPKDIITIGRSIGSAPASFLASKRPIAALILLSAFTSIRAVAQNLIGRLFKYIVSERFEIIKFIAEVNCPVLFIHGQKDNMIPFEHTLKLKEECKAPFEVLLPEEMDHNEFDIKEHLVKPLKAFLLRHLGEKEDLKDKDKKFINKNYCKSFSVSNKFFLIPFCIVKMIKKTDEENNKPSVFSCFGFYNI